MRRILLHVFPLAAALMLAAPAWADEWRTTPATGDVPSPRCGHSLVKIGDYYYLFGGTADVPGDAGAPARRAPSAELFRYDPDTGGFSRLQPGGEVPPGMSGHTAATVDGKMYIIGGSRYGGKDTNQYVYDPASNTWIAEPVPEQFGSRQDLSGVVIDGRVYTVGGKDTTEPSRLYDDTWRYDPAARSWVQLPAFPGGARYGHATAGYGDQFYLFSGRNSEGATSDLWRFNTQHGYWEQLPQIGPTPPGRSHQLALAGGTRIWMVGGRGGSGEEGKGAAVAEPDLGDVYELDMTKVFPEWRSGNAGPARSRAAGWVEVAVGKRGEPVARVRVFGGLSGGSPVPWGGVLEYRPGPGTGDVNLDGVVDALDAGRLAGWLAGNEEEPAVDRWEADLNDDGRADPADLVLLRRVLP